MYINNNVRENMLQQNTQYEYKEQDPAYMGEPFDPYLAQGPTQDRKCRDIFCCILYILNWVGLVVIAIYALSHGQPHLLASPFDSSGQQCGYSSGYEKFPYGYFNINNLSQFACINQCPQTGLVPTINYTCIQNNSIIPCIKYGNYSTLQFVGICYPTNDTIAQAIDLGLGFYDQSISDLLQTWPISLSIIFLTLILSLILLFFIRACGGCLVISTIILYFGAIIAFGVVCLMSSKGKININIIGQDQSLMQTLAIVAFVIAGISFIILICSIRKIRIGIMVIRTTAKFTQQQCQTILVPVFMFITIALFFSLWIVVSIYIFSCGTVSQCEGSPYACIDWQVGVKRSLGFYFFALFWNSQVAIGMCQFVIASTTAYWYFSHLKGQKVSSPVCKSFCRAMFYHLGSIAFGALILCILLILQLIFQVLHKISKQQTISTDPVTNACNKFCISCTRCCLACFQRFVRFISHNAFIMMAITGSGFCSAAHEAFYLILRSASAYAISHGVGHLIMFFGKLLITSVCTFVGYILITQIQYFSTQIFSPVMPTIIFFVISYVISSLFMDVFGIGSDTLLLCYCLERDIHKGRAKSCPQQLRSIIEV